MNIVTKCNKCRHLYSLQGNRQFGLRCVVCDYRREALDHEYKFERDKRRERRNRFREDWDDDEY